MLAANAAGMLGSSVFAGVGLARPAYAAEGQPVTPLVRFWAASSAVRTFAVGGPLLVALARRTDDAASALLTVAGLVQLGDAAIGVWQRNRGMTVVPAVVGVAHLATARRRIGRRDRR